MLMTAYSSIPIITSGPFFGEIASKRGSAVALTRSDHTEYPYIFVKHVGTISMMCSHASNPVWLETPAVSHIGTLQVATEFSGSLSRSGEASATPSKSSNNGYDEQGLLLLGKFEASQRSPRTISPGFHLSKCGA